MKPCLKRILVLTSGFLVAPKWPFNSIGINAGIRIAFF